MKFMYFAKRNIIELLRDPISYIFCLAFPLIMLVVMSIVNESIPAEANMTVFQIQNLAPGIVVFSFSFTMLFTTLQISKDRSTAFLMRLYASPMKSTSYIIGYSLPMLIIALCQCLITYICAFVIAVVGGNSLDIAGLAASVALLIPSAFMFIGLGIVFGSLFNDKAAPGLSSIIITMVSMLGGVFMDIDGMGGVIKDVSRVLPFYHNVKLPRLAIAGNWEDVINSLLISLLYTVVVLVIAVLVFKSKMKKDIK